MQAWYIIGEGGRGRMVKIWGMNEEKFCLSFFFFLPFFLFLFSFYGLFLCLKGRPRDSFYEAVAGECIIFVDVPS